MRAAFVIFDGMTALDFVGVYDPLGRLRTMGMLPEFEWRVCAPASPVTDDRGLRFLPDEVGRPLSSFDLLVVSGGYGTRALQHDAGFLEWLRTAEAVPLKASVCTGALLLGAAGFLTGKPVTTHPNAAGELGPYCGEVRRERVVDAGDVVTAGGVTAAIDLGLYLVERLAGTEARRCMAAQMDYPPGPLRATWIEGRTMPAETDLPFDLESDLERVIARDPAWRAGLDHGEPRPGHPEGSVARHIAEVLANVESFYGDSELRGRLRLIALVHDTFKYQVDPSQWKTGENHHAMRARRFAERSIPDSAVLDVIELHDEAYNAWQKGQRDDNWERAEVRAQALLDRLGENLGLYLAFYRCDNATGDKSQEPLCWFEEFAARQAGPDGEGG